MTQSHKKSNIVIYSISFVALVSLFVVVVHLPQSQFIYQFSEILIVLKILNEWSVCLLAAFASIKLQKRRLQPKTTGCDWPNGIYVVRNTCLLSLLHYIKSYCLWKWNRQITTRCVLTRRNNNIRRAILLFVRVFSIYPLFTLRRSKTTNIKLDDIKWI